MKRTREAIFREHPEWQQREGVSGLKEFDGEDLCLNKYNSSPNRVRIKNQIQ